MKKILITGANSYIGTSFEKYMSQWPDKYQVNTLDMQDDNWRDFDFSNYYSIFHVAGIAHADVGKVTDEQKKLYYAVNTDLTIETAKKAKSAGVKQFIFMSSAIVYGDSAPIGKSKIITRETPLNPANFYGDSKVQAELGLQQLNDDSFNVVILRPPMIYGPGSKGNYKILSKMAQKLPVFPKVNNQRSMLFVDNLMEFVRLMIENDESGVFWPQNAEYSNTSDLVKTISKVKHSHIILIPGFTFALKILSHFTGLVNKAFGNLTYDLNISEYKYNYRIASLNESIKQTELKPKALILASVASMIDQFNMPNIQLLLDMGYEVDVICNCKVGNTISDERIQTMIENLGSMGVSVIHIDIPRRITDIKNILFSTIKVKIICDKNHYQLLHCHSPIGSVIARLAARNARKHGTKVIYTAHGFHFYKGAPIKNWLIYFPVEYICAFLTDTIITINKEDYELAKKHMHAKHIEYVPGVGIDVDFFRNTVVDRDKKREELGIPTDAYLLLSVGELNANKNHEVVIKALNQLNDSNVHYAIAGQGELKDYLQDLATNCNLHLLGYRSDVNELLKCADAFVFPSIREGQGLAAIEAMVAGLPLVISDNRGLRGTLLQNEHALIYNCADYRGFADGIRTLHSSSDISARLARNNVQKSMDFDISKINKLMKELYENA